MEIIDGLHDIEIVGIFHDKKNKIFHVQCDDGKNSNISIKMTGCRYLKVADFSFQNIVSRFIVFNNKSKEEYIYERLSWIATLDGLSVIDNDRLKSTIKNIEDGDVKIAYFEPSWGAEIGVVFKEFTLNY